VPTPPTVLMSLGRQVKQIAIPKETAPRKKHLFT
jgi:hypothetical protein